MSSSTGQSESNPPNGGKIEDETSPDANGRERAKSQHSVFAKLKRLWAKTGITLLVFELMFKGALAPTIAIAAYQSTEWADEVSTTGYLVGIIATLAMPIQPRAKFLQTLLINILMICIGCAVEILAVFCCVQARIHGAGSGSPGTGGSGTSGLAGKGAETAQYSSSASAVAGVWLFIQIYIISVLRARMPQYTIPCIMWAIFADVGLTYAPQLSTLDQGLTFALQLLKSFLIGISIATGISLFIFPITCRKGVFDTLESFIAGLRSALGANMEYLDSLEGTDMFAAQKTNTAGKKPSRSPEAESFLLKMQSLASLQAKLHTDMPFAKREIALGKLGPDDLQKLFRLLRLATLPLVGLSHMSDIFDRISEQSGWDRSKSFVNVNATDLPTGVEKIRVETINEWHELIKTLKQPFGEVTHLVDEGLQHVAITLQFLKRPKESGGMLDREAQGDSPQPGDKDFEIYFDRHSREFLESKKMILRAWCRLHGIELPEDFFSNPSTENFEAPAWMNEGHFTKPRQSLRRQLMLMLYVDQLLYDMSRRVLDLIVFANSLRDSGKLRRTRLIVPGFKRLRKWVLSALFHEQDTTLNDHMDANDHGVIVHLGDAFSARRDPEHLPPANSWEHFSNQFRRISHFFASPASAFGFRAAVATMAVAILSFLSSTQTFFTRNRLFWAQIMVSIAMVPSAGKSLRNFILRVAGTTAGMLLSWIAWYIVDGRVAGVLVFYFILLHIGVYILIKRPTLAPVGILVQVTMTLVLGYELQTRKIGIQRAESNGQQFFPVFILGPLRLATVISGLFVAWIFTIFPYPVSEHSQLRKSLGSSLYLLANYYSVVHETVRTRVTGREGNMSVKDSPGRRLEKVRNKVYAKCNILLSSLQEQAGATKYDIPIGGKFPRKQYDDIVEHLRSVLQYMALVSIASAEFPEPNSASKADSRSQWLNDLRNITSDVNLTSQAVTSFLSLLSASLTSGRPLPPYLTVPEPYELAHKMDTADEGILSIRHIAEPGYAAFAVVEIGTKCIMDDLKSLLGRVRELVGELDFSFHVTNTTDTLKVEPLGETLVYTTTRSAEQARTKGD